MQQSDVSDTNKYEYCPVSYGDWILCPNWDPIYLCHLTSHWICALPDQRVKSVLKNTHFPLQEDQHQNVIVFYFEWSLYQADKCKYKPTNSWKIKILGYAPFSTIVAIDISYYRRIVVCSKIDGPLTRTKGKNPKLTYGPTLLPRTINFHTSKACVKPL